MTRRTKLLFIAPQIGGGGSQRMILNLCNNLNRKKFDITLLLLVAEGDYLHLIKDDVKLIDLKIDESHGIIRNTFKCLFLIPKIIKKIRPDIVMSTITHINVIMAIIRFLHPKNNVSFIARESNILSIVSKEDPWYLRCLYHLFYRYFDRIVAQSADMKEDLMRNYSIAKDKIVVIHNFVDDDYIDEKLTENKSLVTLPADKINLLSIGRLEYQKGYDLLLKSFSEISDKQKFHLTIFGRGHQAQSLKNLIDTYSLESLVTISDFTDNPYIYMQQADVFISSSRFEGFPNVVIEALSCGLPVVANNYPGGINEIIDGPAFGYIVNIEDSAEFYNAISKCIALKKSEKISMEARKKYSKNNVLRHYEALFINKPASQQ
jgi:glycosyltransferase involved in cell wall biosynthesis